MVTQSIILTNFIQYLEHTKEDYLAELEEKKKNFPLQAERIGKQQEEFKKHIEELTKQLNEGHCFGFSVVHGAMDDTEKLEWWEHALVEIANWNKQRDSLNETVKLPGTIIESGQTHQTDVPDKLQESTKPADVIILPTVSSTPKQNYNSNGDPTHPPPFTSIEKDLTSAAIFNSKTATLATVKSNNLLLPTLRDIFARALNYIVVSHAVDVSHYHPNMDQLNILQPDAHVIDERTLKIKRSYFEMVDETAKEKDSRVKTIEKRKIIAGTFTTEQLLKDLDDNLSSKSLLLIHGLGHTIRICRKGTDWMVYDPNYDHTKLTTIHKIGTKSECIAEVFRILGNSIAIEAGLFNEHTYLNFPEHTRLLNESPASLLKGHGLWIMAKHSPEILTAILKKGYASEEERKNMILTLTEAMTQKRKSNNWTALHMITHKAPEAFTEIMKLMDTSVEGRKLFASMTQVAAEINSHGYTPLHTLGRYSPEVMIRLLELIDESAEGKALQAALIQALQSKDKKNKTLLRLLTNTNVFLKYMQAAIKANQGLQLLLDAILVVANDDNASYWHILFPHVKDSVTTLFADQLIKQSLDISKMAKTEEENEILRQAYAKIGSPQKLFDGGKALPNLPLYIDFMLQTPNGLHNVLNGLAQKYHDNKTGWQIICDKHPTEKKHILESIKKHLASMTVSQLIQSGNDIRLAFYRKDSKYRGICKQSALFHGKYVKTEIWKTMLETVQELLGSSNTKEQHKDDTDFDSVMQERLPAKCF